MRSGLPHLCSFDTPAGSLSATTAASAQRFPYHQRSNDELHQLRAEVAELKELLSKAPAQHKDDDGLDFRKGATDMEDKNLESKSTSTSVRQIAESNEPSDPRSREPCSFYGRHNLLQFFTEVIKYPVDINPCLPLHALVV